MRVISSQPPILTLNLEYLLSAILTAKFTFNLKKVGKTTRPFKYGLNQIPYDYRVKETNRFKGPDLIDRVPKELWIEVPDSVPEAGIKTIPAGQLE